MKKLILLFAIQNLSMAYSQTPVRSLSMPITVHQTNAYYKDTDGIFDDYVGTYIYDNGAGTVLELRLRKLEQQLFPHPSRPYFEDVLVGAYKYVNNSIIVVDNLATFFTNQPHWEFNINGNNIIGKTYKPTCAECSENEKRIQLRYMESDRQNLASAMILRRFIDGDTQKLKIKILQKNNTIIIDEVSPPYCNMKIPFGEYELIKQ